MHQSKRRTIWCRDKILLLYFSILVSILDVLGEWKYPACGRSRVCRPTSGGSLTKSSDLLRFPHRLLKLFDSEHVKHSAVSCWWKSKVIIRSEFKRVNPLIFVSHLPTICVRRAFSPGPRSAPSVCLKCHEWMRLRQFGPTQFGIFCDISGLFNKILPAEKKHCIELEWKSSRSRIAV